MALFFKIVMHAVIAIVIAAFAAKWAGIFYFCVTGLPMYIDHAKTIIANDSL